MKAHKICNERVHTGGSSLRASSFSGGLIVLLLLVVGWCYVMMLARALHQSSQQLSFDTNRVNQDYSDQRSKLNEKKSNNGGE